MPFNEAAIAQAARLILAGEPVAAPTETVYGLAADATNGEAVARIYAAKGRPSFNPLIVHVMDLAAAERLAHFDDTARALAEAHWPGPLTLVLPRRADCPVASIVTAGLKTIAVRVPNHPAMQALLEASGRPLAPDALFGTTELPLVGRYPTFRLVQIAVAVGLGLWLLLARTKLGLMVRAGVDDQTMLSACGVNVPRVALAVFALGAALAGLGGVIGATAQPLAQGMDGRFLLTSLVVVIVGGMGSVPGTAVGSVLVGLAEQIGQALFPTYAVILTFGLMVAVLAVRPQGLMGRSA